MNTAAPPAAPRSPRPPTRACAAWRTRLRALAMDAVEQANSGHPGMPMGMADAATVLFTQFLRFDPQAPDWPDRDRFVLSAGHGSMLLYGLLHLLGYPDMTLDELKRFRQLGSRTAGHPERGLATGIETTTGPLGQGLANSVGMALAERHLAAEFGDDLVNHYTYVICGDGCLMEGISHEAISLAGHLRLNKLILLWDDNSITIDGSTEPFGFRRPARTLPRAWLGGRARRRAQRRRGRRRDPPGADARPAEPDRLQDDDRVRRADQGRHRRGAWQPARRRGDQGRQGAAGLGIRPVCRPRRSLCRMAAGRRRAASSVRQEWERRLAAAPADRRAEFERRFKGDLPQDFDAVIAKVCDDFRAKNAKIATRQASGEVLDALLPALPEIIGGSADLTPSNNTKAKDEREIKPGDFAGRYIHFGMREHGHGGGDERHRRAWRTDPLWRHVSDLYRLRPPGDPPVGADGGARRLCDDARFDRSRRGRADASAGRASRGPARDPATPGVSPGRPGRDRGVLGAGAEESDIARRSWR